MKAINIEIKDERVIGSGVVIGTEGSHDDYCLNVKLDSMWDGLSKKAIWQNAKGNNTVFVLITSDMEKEDGSLDIPIPTEAKEFSGKASMSLKGYAVDGDVETKAVISVSSDFVVLPSVSDSDAEAAQEPTPTIAEQLQAEIDQKVDKASGKGLSDNNYTTAEKEKVSNLPNNTFNELLELDGHILDINDDVLYIKSDISSLTDAVDNKVDKISGKGLSQNDYTNEDKAKVDIVDVHDDNVSIGSDWNVSIDELSMVNSHIDGSLKLVGDTDKLLFNNGNDTLYDYLNEKADKTTTYTKTQVDGFLNQKANTADIPTKTSDITNDSGFITVTDVPTKTSELVNDSGFLAAQGGSISGIKSIYVDGLPEDIHFNDGNNLQEYIDDKQDVLRSGIDIKTINNQSVLGSGNIEIQSGGEARFEKIMEYTLTEPINTVSLTRETDGTAFSFKKAMIIVHTKTPDANADCFVEFKKGTLYIGRVYYASSLSNKKFFARCDNIGFWDVYGSVATDPTSTTTSVSNRVNQVPGLWGMAALGTDRISEVIVRGRGTALLPTDTTITIWAVK